MSFGEVLDIRTGQFIAAPVPDDPPPDPEALLAQARESASLPRAEFLLACVSAGLLTPQDALLAAKGEMPAAYAGVIEEWPAPQQFEAGLRWAALTVVDRMHPLILAVADAMDIPDAQLDALFGIGGAP